MLIACFDQMRNAWIFFNLFVSIYLVDTLFNFKDVSTENKLFIPGNREATAIIIGILMFAPLALLHIWDIVKLKLGLTGLVRTFIRSNLFRKYLNYSEEQGSS